MRRKVLGLAGAGVSIAAGAALIAGSATAGAAPAAKPSQVSRPAVTGAFVPVPPGQNRAATVTCPAGTVVTGGGGQTSAFQTFFTDSFRSGNGWTVRGTNTATAIQQLRAVAVCAATV